MKEKINYEDVSVVLQGPVNRDTMKCINSVKQVLPGSEIILATWKDSCTEFLDCDKIIYCDDPGCAYWNPPKTVALNINRWIVSSVKGVSTASRKYVLKMRTDLEIVNDQFLGFFYQFTKRQKEYSLARHKILIPSIYTTKFIGHTPVGKNEIPTPLHLSDWYCFGLKDDIWDFVNIPLIEDLEDFSRYYERRPYLIKDSYAWWLNYWLRRYAPEQYIGLCYAKRKFPEWDLANFLSFDDIDQEESERFIVNNFIILDPVNFGIVFKNSAKCSISMDISNLNEDFRYGLYSQYIYIEDYKKYCDPSYSEVNNGIDIRVDKKTHWKYRIKPRLISIFRKISPTYNIACINRQRIDAIEKNITQKIVVAHREMKDEIQNYGG